MRSRRSPYEPMPVPMRRYRPAWHRRAALLLLGAGVIIVVATSIGLAVGWDGPWRRPELGFACGLALTATGAWFVGVFDRAR